MGDKMMFPERIDDFLLNYSFMDNKKIYTNGSRLIQTYRVEQALMHYGQEIRNKAIDEFAERLKNKYPIMEDCFGVPNVNYNLHKGIDEIAEEMRGAL
jgi:hypothetical protein